MTLKEKQIEENEKVVKAYEEALPILERWYTVTGTRLRTCDAMVYTVDDYRILRSYATVVAMITPDGELYDFLRYVYKYTVTSAQHVSKFAQDYHAVIAYTYRRPKDVSDKNSPR